MAKTREEISEAIRAFITDAERQADADISEGTVYRDVSVEYVADKLADVSTDIDDSYNSSSVKFADILTLDGMSQLALNYFVRRDPATKSSGTVRFDKKTAPTTTITVAKRTVVETRLTAKNEKIQFVTTESVAFTTSTPMDAYTRQYHVFATVEAVLAGASGNDGKKTVVIFQNNIIGIDAVTNVLPMSNGSDAESNVSLASKCLEATEKKILGTKAGYEETLLDYSPLITDVNVVTTSDEEMTRDIYGGAVDIYIDGTDPESFTYNTNYSPGKSYIWIDSSYRPTLAVSSLIGTTTSVVYQEGADWSFSKSTNTTTGYSVESYDVINWVDGGTKPFSLEQLTITGTYEALVRGAQDYIDNPVRRFVTADQLVKNMTRVGIQVDLNILAYSGFNRTNLESVLETAVNNGITTYTAGDDVEQADLVKLLYDSSGGVDKVYLPFTYLCKTGESSSADISIGKNEFARIDGITITAL